MSDSRAGYRQILRATAMIGGASLAVVAMGVLRMKFFALVLGPDGVGRSGLYTNLLMTAGTVIGLGVSSSAVREMAAAANDAQRAAAMRAAIIGFACLLTPLAIVFFWVFRQALADTVLHLPQLSGDVAWLGIGAAATILNMIGFGLLQGMRQTAQFSRANIVGTAIGSVASVTTIWLLGAKGIFLSVLLIPVALSAVAWFEVLRTPFAPAGPLRANMAAHGWPILRLGLPLMASTVVQSGSLLIVRSTLTAKLGLDSAGFFQAATLISSAYVAFVLQSMAGDYYPRLTASLDDPVRAREMVNHQAQVAVALALPLIVGTMGFTPLLIQLFYSGRFEPAADILQWQVFGDLFKIMAWPVGFVMLARGAAMSFFGTEFLWNALYVVLVALGLGHFGLQITGTAYLACYVLYLGVVMVAARKLLAFRLSRETVVLWLSGFVLCAITCAASFAATPARYAIAAATTFAAALVCLRTLSVAASPETRLGTMIARLRAASNRILRIR